MKKNVLPNGKSKRLTLALAFLVWAVVLPAQTEKSRTIEKVFEGKTALWASHRYGDLILKKGSGSQMKAVLTVTASSKDQNELQQFLDYFNLEAAEAADNKVDLKTAGSIENWKTVNGRSTIKFKDGKSFSGIYKFNMVLEITVPKLRYATLENKYDAIQVEDGTTSILEIKLYEGRIDAPGTFEKLALDLKYAKGSVGNFNSCTAELYDSDLSIGNGGALSLESKYSGLKIGKLQSLNLNCYDDDYQIGGVSGTTDIKDKYSEFRFSGDLATATFDLYDSKMDLQNADNIRISSSKYTEYSCRELNTLHFDDSYDDAVRLEKVGTLSANASKYTEYTVDGLWKNLNFPSSYDDAIKVRNVGGTFSGLTFDGKYTDLTFPIPPAVKYEINAYLKYGKLLFPEDIMETAIYKEKNDEVTVQAKVKGAEQDAPKISIKSYDGQIQLK